MRLTKIERKLFELILENNNMPDKEIATKLNITEEEVQSTRNTAGKKLILYITRKGEGQLINKLI